MMSYESRFENEYKNYKVDFIEILDEVEEGRLPVLPDMRVELDVVYAQAAKTDEYEAKAKAFDVIDEQYEEIMKEVRNRKFKVTGDLTRIGLVVEKVIKDYESGELDV